MSSERLNRPTKAEMEDQVFASIQAGNNSPETLMAAMPNAYRDEILSAVWRLADLGEVDFTAGRRIIARERLFGAGT